MTMKARLKMKNRLHRYDINRPRPRHGDKYTKYKMCLTTTMVICIKGYLRYKTITPQNVLSDAQVRNFFIS